jgi:hypothetical protein
MKTTRIMKTVLILLSILIITACNLPFNILDRVKNSTGETNTSEGDSTAEAPLLFGNNNNKEIDPNPVGLQDGLGSLDSYQLTISVNSYTSKGAKTEVTETIERSVVDGNSHSFTTTVTFDPENDTEESSDTMEMYSIGNETCQKSGDEWEYDSITDQDKEFRDIFSSMVDFIPLIDNPEFVATETMNGVETNHFTFQVEGIGDTSGSVATVNSGDYWLAVDGQYIVKYQLVLEVRSAAEGTADADVSNLEALVDLTNINVPVELSLPADCYP